MVTLSGSRTTKHFAKTEDVQHHANKLIPSISDKEYPDRLAALKLPSQEHRQKRAGMTDLYKYLHKI